MHTTNNVVLYRPIKKYSSHHWQRSVRVTVWTVLPRAVNHILGTLLLSPTTCNAWGASKDEKTSYVWLTLPMACNWGQDKGYELHR